jgi:hypothetical protein
MVWQKSVGAERGRETCHTPRNRSKALKGEAQERGKLRKAFVGGGGLRRREGSQTLRAGLLKSREKLFERWAKSPVKKRVLPLGHAEGSRHDARSFPQEAGSA